MHFTPRAICAAVTLLLAAGASVAQTADPLRDAAQKADASALMVKLA